MKTFKYSNKLSFLVVFIFSENSQILKVRKNMQSTYQIYKKKLNQRERTHAKVPQSNISLIATIIGNVSHEKLRKVIQKMQLRHPILNSHLESKSRDVFLLADAEIEIPVKIISREREEQWKEIILEEHKIPFEMTKGPLIRFILLFSAEISDLIIFCQHTICDGMSLAYLARDILNYLGNPYKEVEILPPAPVVDENNIPSDIKPGLAIRLLGKTISKKWEKNEVLFNYMDFQELHKVFWKNYNYKAHLYELSSEDTKSLILACRKHGVTVNTTLIAAFAIAQNKLNSKKPKYLTKYGAAVDLRKVLITPVGEQFGFFASGIQLKYKYSSKDTLWDVAKKLYKDANPENAKNQALIKTLSVFELPSSLMEAQFFAAFGHLIPPNSPSYKKIQAFINDDKNLAVKMVKKKLSKGIVMAQIMTNLGKMDFPKKYGELILKNLILMPSCSPYTELVLGVMTHGGSLSITLNHMESTINTEKVLEIKDIANKLIMSAIKN